MVGRGVPDKMPLRAKRTKGIRDLPERSSPQRVVPAGAWGRVARSSPTPQVRHDVGGPPDRRSIRSLGRLVPGGFSEAFGRRRFESRQTPGTPRLGAVSRQPRAPSPVGAVADSPDGIRALGAAQQRC